MKNLLTYAAALGLALITSTAKAEISLCTEITSLPTNITKAGIYCLKKNLEFTPVAGFPSGFLDGVINIHAHNVTIDLNGFSISNSVAGPGNKINGISSVYIEDSIIRNGTVTGFRHGILHAGFAGKRNIIENMRIHANTEYGIYAVGEDHVIRNNIVTNTGPGDHGDSAAGILVTYGGNSVVENNIVNGVTEINSAAGIATVASGTSRITGNTIYNIWGATDTNGVFFYSSHSSEVHNNHIIGSGTVGIRDGGFSTNMACIGNVIGAYTTASSGCTVSSGNISY